MESRTKKILIGILAVIGAGFLIIAGAIIAFIIWIRTPTPVIDTVQLLGPETTGFATLILDDDADARGFIEAVEDAYTESAGDPEVPMPFGMTPRADLDVLLPSRATWTMSADPAGRDLHLGSVSLPRVGRWLSIVGGVVGMFGGDDGLRVERYQGERIIQIDTPDFRGTYFDRNGTVFLTSSIDAARNAVDRLDAAASDDGGAEAAGEPTALETLFAETDATAPLRGAVDNANGEIGRILEALGSLFGDQTIESPVVLSEIGALAFSGHLTRTGGFDGQAVVFARNPPWTAEDAALVTGTFGRLSAEDLRDIELDVEARAEGNRLVVDIRIPNLADALVVDMPPPGRRGSARR